ncbi:MAG: cation:proton antiporter [Actinobacteria bacterium]|nr:cation:proton antiporter [Actinomycetota bacterium]
MIGVDAVSFLVIVSAAAVGALITALFAPRLIVPVVVVELVLGILVGPQVGDLAHLDAATKFFSNLGLGMLFFFAGYEIDFQRIRGRPLALATGGWLLSLGLAYGLAGILFAGNVIDSDLYTGSAIATTAIGTLIPILRDTGELRTKFGTQLLAAGAMGEFGPIVLVTVVLTTRHPVHEAAILILFILLAVFMGIVAVRSTPKGWVVLERTFEASSQLAVRLAVVLIFGLVALATELGLDLLLGGFVAGMITRLALRGREVAIFESKLTAIGYGFLIPFFFVVSGMGFDVKGLFTSPSALLKLPLFAAFFLIVRGVPALLFYRKELDLRDRAALGFFCATELPLVVAITALARAHHDMRASTVSALVGAAIISTLVYPLIGMKLRRRRAPAQAGILGAH